jgi:hypothetical protein
MLMRKTTLLISVLLFLSTHLYSQPVTWDSSTSYSTGALVIVGTSTYIATKSVPANNTPPNTTYWTDLSVAATALSVPVEDVPTLSTDTILASLPGSAPDANSTTGGGSSGGKLINLSSRGFVGFGEQRFIGGFKVYGGDCKIIVRGFGPSRDNADNLDDPLLTWKTNPTSLHGNDGVINIVDDKAENNNLLGQVASTQSLIDALLPTETADIQIASSWNNDTSKGYTAFLTPSKGSAGIGRIGINDINEGNGGQLMNISTRCYIGSDASQYLFAGFQIRDGNASIVIQGFGPSRSSADALADPVIELIRQVSSFHSTKATIGMNDDFDSAFSGLSNSGQQVSFPKPSIPSGFNSLIAREACLVVTLEPGDYVARVFGKNGATGIGRVGVNIILE